MNAASQIRKDGVTVEREPPPPQPAMPIRSVEVVNGPCRMRVVRVMTNLYSVFVFYEGDGSIADSGYSVSFDGPQLAAFADALREFTGAGSSETDREEHQ